MVESRCAITKLVRSAMIASIARVMYCSVRVSTLEVASSRMRIAGSVTIARAMVTDPAILILDEATSSVDTRTEQYITRAMEAIMADRTSFVIAHRLSTIVDADLILVMDNGDIVEKGTHRELLEQGGVYADLYRSQFA